MNQNEIKEILEKNNFKIEDDIWFFLVNNKKYVSFVCSNNHIRKKILFNKNSICDLCNIELRIKEKSNKLNYSILNINHSNKTVEVECLNEFHGKTFKIDVFLSENYNNNCKKCNITMFITDDIVTKKQKNYLKELNNEFFKNIEEKQKLINEEILKLELTHKFCMGHLIWEPKEKFFLDKRNSDGLGYTCRELKNEQNKKYSKSRKVSSEELEQLKINKTIKHINLYYNEIDGILHKNCIQCFKNLEENKFPVNGRKYLTGMLCRSPRCIECTNFNKRKRRNEDHEYKVLCNLRTRVYSALNLNIKSDKTINLLGCSIEFLWNYLILQFRDGMTIDNYGSVWHIDHIIPCSAFNLSNEIEQKICFNYRNLQPLFAKENLIKNNNYKQEDKDNFIKNMLSILE